MPVMFLVVIPPATDPPALPLIKILVPPLAIAETIVGEEEIVFALSAKTESAASPKVDLTF